MDCWGKYLLVKTYKLPVVYQHPFRLKNVVKLSKSSFLVSLRPC